MKPEYLKLSPDLNGKKVLVTGASSGIGLATVETFARGGATVALNYLPDDPRGARETINLLNKEGLSVHRPGFRRGAAFARYGPPGAPCSAILALWLV